MLSGFLFDGFYPRKKSWLLLGDLDGNWYEVVLGWNPAGVPIPTYLLLESQGNWQASKDVSNLAKTNVETWIDVAIKCNSSLCSFQGCAGASESAPKLSICRLSLRRHGFTVSEERPMCELLLECTWRWLNVFSRTGRYSFKTGNLVILIAPKQSLRSDSGEFSGNARATSWMTSKTPILSYFCIACTCHTSCFVQGFNIHVIGWLIWLIFFSIWPLYPQRAW